MKDIEQKWRSYFSRECDDDIEGLAESYPDQRSLYVDLIDVHSFDSEFLQALFEDPEDGFAAGESVLREILGVSGLVHVRIENNPQQRSVAGIRAYHVGDLVTVTGAVESVGPARASTITAAYECPVCEASTTLAQAGIEMDTPTRCDNCGWDGEFDFLTGDSTFVDLQEITLTSQPDDDGWITAMSAYLDDDIVGSATEGDRYNVTGVVRAHRDGETNEFRLYLDALSVREEGQVTTPETPDGVLDSHWGLGE